MSLALIITGGVFMTRGNGLLTRSEQIEIFNRAAASWAAGGQQQFATQGPFTVTLSSSVGVPGGVATSLVVGSADVQQVTVEQGKGIGAYSTPQHVAYVATASPFNSTQVPLDSSTANGSKVTVTVSGPAGASAPFSIDMVFSSASRKGWTACEYGTAQDNLCVGYFVPSPLAGPLCVAVDASNQIKGPCGVMDSSGAKALGYLSSGSIDANYPLKLNYFSFTYASYQAGYPSSFPWVSPPTPASPQVVVRSINDPYVVFLSLTGGYSEFGVRNMLTLIQGYTMLGVGLLLMTPFVFGGLYLAYAVSKDSCCHRRTRRTNPPAPTTMLVLGNTHGNNDNHNNPPAPANDAAPRTVGESFYLRFRQAVDVGGRPFERAGRGLRAASRRVFGRGGRPVEVLTGNGLDAQGQPSPDAAAAEAAAAPQAVVVATTVPRTPGSPLALSPRAASPRDGAPGAGAGRSVAVPPGLYPPTDGSAFQGSNPLWTR